jgi:tetratricopeptide (TPR) repeat protein
LEALARAYLKQGNKQEAIRFYKLSLQQNPRNESARKQLLELGVKVP